MIRRESSEYLRQKQKQWELQKAESENRSEWFPFGENLTPGGGSPLRKHTAKCDFSKEELTNTASCSTMTIQPPEKTEEEPQNLETMEKSINEQKPISGAQQHQQHQQQQHTYPFPLYPAYTFPYQYTTAYHHPPSQHQQDHQHPPFPQDSGENSEKPPIFAPHYQVIPAGAIPVSTINIDPSQICPVDQLGMWAMPPPTGPNGMRYGIPIPAPFVPQIMTTSATSCSGTSVAVLNAMMMSSTTSSGGGGGHLLHHPHHHQNHNNNGSGSDSSSESGVSGVKDDEVREKKRKNEEDEEEEDRRQSTSDYTDDDPIPLSRRSTATSSGRSAMFNYAEQIEARRRHEQEEENRERAEMLEVERQRRILEDRRNSEEERRKMVERERLEEERRRTEQFAEAMEKARKEAELLKKAKLYKHVLRGAEEEGGDEQLKELEQKILGVDIQTGRRLLQEVSHVEWHKKQDEAEMKKKHQKVVEEEEKNNQSIINNGSMSQRGRSASVVGNSPAPPSTPKSPFGRNTFGRRSVRTTSREKQVQMEEKKNRNGQKDGEDAMSNRQLRTSPPADPLPPPSPQSHRQDHHPPLHSNHPPHNPPNHQQDHPPHPPQDQVDPESVHHPHSPLTSTPQAGGAHHLQHQRDSEMLKTGGFYCPINREPLTYREEAAISRQKATTTTGSAVTAPGGRHNEITQSALFGPISTRCSVRRGQMRGIMQSPASVRIPASSNSFEESSSGGEDGGSLSPELSHKNFESPLPSSTENVHPAPNSPPLAKNEKDGENGNFEFRTPIRTRSALGSPMSFLNGGDTPTTRCDSPSAQSRLMQRLQLKGNIRRDDQETSISQDVRRVTETNLSRSPSMASLRGSFQNLSLRGSHLNLAGHSAEPSPNLSKFASINSPARQSLTSMRKTTDRQAAVLERLGRLRESLHAGKNYTPPRGNFHVTSNSSRLTTPAGTPPISPRPVL